MLAGLLTRITGGFHEALKTDDGAVIRGLVCELARYVRRIVRRGQKPRATARVLSAAIGRRGGV
jgi:hypothetical protein